MPCWTVSNLRMPSFIMFYGWHSLPNRSISLTASIASRFHITKYPTLKLLRNGQATKREYRGQRSADAFASYIKEQLQDPIKVLDSLDELPKLEVSFKRGRNFFIAEL